jgi:hypothetical protein
MDPNEIAKYAIVIIIIYFLYLLVKKQDPPPPPAVKSDSKHLPNPDPSMTIATVIDQDEKFLDDLYFGMKIPASETREQYSLFGVRKTFNDMYILHEKGCIPTEKGITDIVELARLELKYAGRNSPRLLRLIAKGNCKNSIEELVIHNGKIAIKSDGKIIELK